MIMCTDLLSQIDAKIEEADEARGLLIDKLISLGNWDGYDKNICRISEIPDHLINNGVTVVHYDNQNCIIKYNIQTFGCTPNIISHIEETGEDITKSTIIGENIIALSLKENQNVTISTNASSDTYIFFKVGSDIYEQRTYSYVVSPDDIINFTIATIAKYHSFDYVSTKIHADKFIYSPGNLIGGFKYKFHWDTVDNESTIENYGQIFVGHMGTAASHIMNFSIGYIVNGGSLQKVDFTFKGSSDYLRVKNNSKWEKASEGTTSLLGITNLSQKSTNVYIQDYELDFTAYSYSDQIQIGIVLKDNGDGCTGIYFGKKDKYTTCKIEITGRKS